MGTKTSGRRWKRLQPCLSKSAIHWRVALALRWAFADFENLNIVADRRTLCWTSW
jgi:hypothetical protein